MTPEERVRSERLAALGELGRARPDWRLGQMLANLAMTTGRMDAGGVWDLEDEEALIAARELLTQSLRKQGKIVCVVRFRLKLLWYVTRHVDDGGGSRQAILQ